jgi:hypothetical protein
MRNNTRIIRFSDGTMIVCMVESLDDIQKQNFINILYPIEIISNGLEKNDGSQMLEQYMLKAWMGLSDDVMFTLNTSDITTIALLREEYIAGYENVVNRLFFRSDEFQNPPEEEELTPEDLLEYLQLKDEGKLN